MSRSYKPATITVVFASCRLMSLLVGVSSALILDRRAENLLAIEAARRQHSHRRPLRVKGEHVEEWVPQFFSR